MKKKEIRALIALGVFLLLGVVAITIYVSKCQGPELPKMDDSKAVLKILQKKDTEVVKVIKVGDDEYFEITLKARGTEEKIYRLTGKDFENKEIQTEIVSRGIEWGESKEAELLEKREAVEKAAEKK